MINHYIDLIQDAKKQFLEFYIHHPEIKNTLVEFVEAQTAYTKAASETGLRTAGKMALIWYQFYSLNSSK
jgi:hypothetical protein